LLLTMILLIYSHVCHEGLKGTCTKFE